MDIFKKIYIPIFITYIFVIIYITYIDKFLGIVTLLIVSLYFYISFKSPEVCSDITQAKDRSKNTLDEETEDVLRNIVSVLNTNNDKFEIERTFKFSNIYSDLCRKTMHCIIKRQALLFPCQIIFIIFSLYRCHYLLKNNTIDVGHVISILLVLLFLSNALERITNSSKSVIIKHGMIKESLTVFDKNPMEEQNNSICDNIDTNDHISVRNVEYKYLYNQKNTLTDINISIKKGDILLVTGRIGTGKTTLIKLLMRYRTPTKGCLYLYGKPYSSIPLKEFREKISFIPQSCLLFNRSIYENIVYGCKEEYSIDEIENFIKKLELQEIFESFENGLNNNVGKNGSKLSGGQRQVVWILRTLLQDPEIIILDEPTASIDETTKKHIYSLLELMYKNRTIIMISHDEALLNRASRVIHLKNGIISERS